MSRRAAAAAAVVVDANPAAAPAAAAAAPVVSERRQRASAAAAATEVTAVKAAPAHVDPAVAEGAAPAAAPTRARRTAQVSAPADAAAATTAAPTPAAVSSSSKPNYDEMTYEQFVASLKVKTKREVLEGLAATYWQAASASEQQEQFTDGAGGYTYTELLTRVYVEHRARNPSHNQEQQRIQMPACRLERIGTKKTAVANFKAICDALNRGVEDVKIFIEKELSTHGSIDSSNCLILKLQNVKAVQFDTVISKYADEYVKCQACRKADSVLIKEDRITTLRCNLCQATRTVTGSGNTYTAVTGKRSKMRMAAASL